MLQKAGVDFDAVDYYVKPISKSLLKRLLKKMNASPRTILRTKEPIYKKLNLGEKDFADEEIIELLVQYPDLLERPIIEKGNRAILARPAERLREIL